MTYLTQTQHAAQLPPELLQIGRWVVLCLVGLLVLALVYASLRRWFLPYGAEKLEEIREPVERLPRPPTTRRTRARARRQTETLESARAYYRLFLHTLAHARPELTRQPDETPLEYQQRVYQDAEWVSKEQGEKHEASFAPSQDARILDTLTRAYMEERYGQQPLDVRQQSSLHEGLPHLLSILTRKPLPERERKSR